MHRLFPAGHLPLMLATAERVVIGLVNRPHEPGCRDLSVCLLADVVQSQELTPSVGGLAVISVRLSKIAFGAKALQVLKNGFTTIGPRLDVVNV